MSVFALNIIAADTLSDKTEYKLKFTITSGATWNDNLDDETTQQYQVLFTSLITEV